MKISIEKEELIRGLSTVKGTAYVNVSAFENGKSDVHNGAVLMRYTDGEMKFITSNILTSTVARVECECDREGEMECDTELLLGIAKMLEGKITLELKMDKILVKGAKGKYEVTSIATYGFPVPKAVEGEKVTLDCDSLREGIKTVSYAKSIKTPTELMGGMSLLCKGNVLRLTCLNGHRIAICNITCPKEFETVIPAVSMERLTDILDEGTVDLTIGNTSAMAECNGTQRYMLLTDGKYFNIGSMLTDKYKTKVKVNREALKSCMTRSRIMMKAEEKRPVIFSITDGEMSVELTGAYGTFRENIPIEKSGDDLEIGFNPEYISNALSVIRSEEETSDLYFAGTMAPLYIYDEARTYTHVILPVNTLAR